MRVLVSPPPLLLLLLLSVAVGSVQLVSCPLNDCEPTLLVSGWLRTNDSAVAAALVPGQAVVDQLGRAWQLNATVVVHVQASAHGPSYAWLSDGDAVRNAYEMARPQSMLEPCPAGAQCCVDAQGMHQVRWLQRNATVYTVDRLQWLGRAPLSVAASVNGVPVSDAVWRSYVDEVLTDEVLSTRRLCDGNGTCVFVPARFLGDGAHLIGVTDATYASAADVCSLPLGFYSSVNGFAFNQLGSFPSAGALNPLDVAGARVYYAVRVSGGAGVLQPQFSVAARIVDAGLAALPRSTTTTTTTTTRAHAAVVVRHEGAEPASFSVSLHDCTGPASLLVQGPHEQTVPARGHDAVFHFALYHPRLNASLIECEARLHGAGGVLLHAARVTARARATTTTACTVDQGPPPACAPADCFTKYGGARNWYDARTGLCQPVTVCDATLLYDPTTNQCNSVEQLAAAQLPPVNASSFLPDLSTFSLVATNAGGNLSSSSSSPGSALGIHCVHGSVNANGTDCACDSGWSTDPNQPAYQFVFCDLASNATSGSSGFQQAGGSGSSAVSTGAVTVLLVVLVVLLIGVCVCCCACKAYKRNRQRKQYRYEETALQMSLHQTWSQQQQAPLPASTKATLPENSWNFALPKGRANGGTQQSVAGNSNLGLLSLLQ